MPSEVSGADQSLSRLVEELQRALEGKSRELADAREQQAATAEILAALSNLPSDPFRVFAEIAVSAARLCDAHDATIFQVDGNVLRVVAHHGLIPSRFPRVLGCPRCPLCVELSTDAPSSTSKLSRSSICRPKQTNTQRAASSLDVLVTALYWRSL